MGWPKGVKRGPRGYRYPGAGPASIASTPVISCSLCSIPKPRSDFYKGRWCKTCHSLRTKVYREVNPDVHRKACKNYFEANEDACRERSRRGSRAYYNANKTECILKNRQWKESNKSKVKATQKVWREVHPDLVRTYNQNRRARKLNAEGSFTIEEWASLCEQHDYRCAICSELKQLTIDHIIPLARNGSNWIANIQPLCQSCNSRKGDRVIEADAFMEEVTLV